MARKIYFTTKGSTKRKNEDIIKEKRKHQSTEENYKLNLAGSLVVSAVVMVIMLTFLNSFNMLNVFTVLQLLALMLFKIYQEIR